MRVSTTSISRSAPTDTRFRLLRVTNFDVGRGWFVEPSAGFIYSSTSVDNFVNPGASILVVPGVISTNAIQSESDV
jgi:hypothetical protein